MSLEHVPIKDLNLIKRKLILERVEKTIEADVLKAELKEYRHISKVINNIDLKIDVINQEFKKRKIARSKEYSENVINRKVDLINQILEIIKDREETQLRKILELCHLQILITILKGLKEEDYGA